MAGPLVSERSGHHVASYHVLDVSGVLSLVYHGWIPQLKYQPSVRLSRDQFRVS
jgi:hypothetical protein